MHIQTFATIDQADQELLLEAVGRLPYALNKVSNPMTSAIAITQHGKHYGNNIFLSNCTLFCAEGSALAASVTANDHDVLKIYLASGRADDKTPNLISPCGNCRQMLHDFSLVAGNPIKVFITTSQQDQVMITDSDELLPAGFKSASLGKMVTPA